MNTRVPSADWVTVEDLERDPHPTLARLRTVGPVVWVPALSGWMITTREDNLAAMRDDVGLTVDDPRFTTGQITGPSMLSTDGAEHARHRTPFARPFRLDAIRERFTHETALEVDRLIDAFASDVELRTQLAGPLAARMMIHALGLDIAAAGDILGWYARIVDAVQQLSAGADLPQDGLDAYADFAGALRIALDAAEGVDEGLLTREERVRTRPDFDIHLRHGGADGHDDLPAEHDLALGVVLRVGVLLHDRPDLPGCPVNASSECPAARGDRGRGELAKDRRV